jgi:hypothetical protein
MTRFFQHIVEHARFFAYLCHVHKHAGKKARRFNSLMQRMSLLYAVLDVEQFVFGKLVGYDFDAIFIDCVSVMPELVSVASPLRGGGEYSKARFSYYGGLKLYRVKLKPARLGGLEKPEKRVYNNKPDKYDNHPSDMPLLNDSTTWLSGQLLARALEYRCKT